MKYPFLLLVLLLPVFMLGQGKKQVNPKVTIRTYVGIPKIIGSQRFRTALNGLLETGVSANLRVAEDVFVGAGYQYNDFGINKKGWSALVSTSTGTVYNKAKLVGQSVFFKVGKDKFFSDIGYFSYSLNFGQNTGTYLKPLSPDTTGLNPEKKIEEFYRENPLSTPLSYKAFYIQPEIAFNFLAEKAVSFSLLISYTYQFYRFDMRAPRFAHVGEIKGAKNNSNVNWINIGIGANLLLGK